MTRPPAAAASGDRIGVLVTTTPAPIDAACSPADQLIAAAAAAGGGASGGDGLARRLSFFRNGVCLGEVRGGERARGRVRASARARRRGRACTPASVRALEEREP